MLEPRQLIVLAESVIRIAIALELVYRPFHAKTFSGCGLAARLDHRIPVAWSFVYPAGNRRRA